MPDLDTRPGPDPVSDWVLKCPACGYCASDLTAIHADVVDFVGSPEYRREVENPRLPEAAAKFAAYARILEKAGQLADAGWVALQGAWVCDDAGQNEPARLCRELAVQYWVRSSRAGDSFCDEAGEFPLVADVLRRAGRFEEALMTCNQGLEQEELPPMVGDILRFEKSLIQRRDQARHNLAEIPAIKNLIPCG